LFRNSYLKILNIASLVSSIRGVQDFQDLQEEVDYVQVEVDHSDDVLFGAERFHDHLRVEDDEARE
jgi:hypothetical protein